MKQLLQGILISSLALSLAASSFATEMTNTEPTSSLAISTQTLASPESDFEFSNGTITGYVGNGGDVVIPEYINGQLVTTIGERALGSISYHNRINTIIMPNSITTLESNAFSKCTATHIQLSSALQTIGSSAFSTSPLTEIAIPEGVTTIETCTFLNNSNLHTVYLPSTIRNIEDTAFDSYNPSLTTVYYAGTESDKNQIEIVDYYRYKEGWFETNQTLLNANWVYNTPVPVNTTEEEQAPVVTETTSKVATPSNVTVLVNGAEVGFGAYNIDGFNYFRLTDLSFSISGTGKQFRVGWDASQNAINLLMGEGHLILGSELQPNSGKNEVAHLFQSPIYCDGSLITPTVYEINGSSYFQLASLTDILGITVGWNNDTKTITIDT